MTSKFVLDSYAWIEYFKGSESGSIIKKLLAEGSSCFTPSIVIAEIMVKYSKENHKFAEKDVDFICSNSTIIPLDVDYARAAGKLKQAVRKKYKNNFGLADAIILAAARKLKAEVVTGDYHFRALTAVYYIGPAVNAINTRSAPQ